jgi:ABC-type lipoprotein release transport system permease subunit
VVPDARLDARIVAGAALVLLAASLAAAWLPVRRALGLDPLEALRAE